MKRVNLNIVFLIMACASSYVYSQIPGDKPKEIPSDTTFIFNSPRSLIKLEEDYNLNNLIGIKLAFSNSGFAFGLNYSRFLGGNFAFDASIFFTGRREAEDAFIRNQFENNLNQIIVANKVNRVYVVPVIASIRTYLFQDKIANSFKPFIGAGAGVNIILQNPYLREGTVGWWNTFESPPRYVTVDEIPPPQGATVYGEFQNFLSSLPDSEFAIKPGGFVDFGVEFNTSINSVGSVNFRYYYIPGEDLGYQSLYNRDISNFGGFFISLNIGKKF